MMSVIFRDPTNRSLILATKGADSSILIRSNNQSQNIKNQIDSFSKTGYRTLVFAEKRID
jgi:magnesium-transporting ATPase (P-type)